MPYKCNIDLAFNLPAGTVAIVDNDGKHCALGKLYAGIAGRPLNVKEDKQLIRHLDKEFFNLLITTFGLKNDVYKHIWMTNDGTVTSNDGTITIEVTPFIDDKGLVTFTHPFAPANHEKAIRMALQAALESGFIELADSSLELVKELKETVKGKESLALV